MRRVVLGAIIAGSFAGSGFAADLPPMSRAAPAVLPAAFSWTGTYVGVNLGGAWGTFDFDPSTTNNLTGVGSAIPRTSIDKSAVIGGFQTGYNWQIGNVVLGVEQDLQFTNLKTSFAYGAAPGGALVAGDGFAAKVDFLSATRFKLGYAWDRFMIYGTGGLETGVLDVTGNYAGRFLGSPATSFTDKHKFHAGWTVGAGLEYAMTNNLFLGVDYRYFDLGAETYNLGAVTPGLGVTSTVASNVNLRASEITARLNLKLSGLGWFGM
jgi:outer membrane immunogenic protein